jgi:hypothetical protein
MKPKIVESPGYWVVKEPRRTEDGRPIFELIPRHKGWTFNGNLEPPSLLAHWSSPEWTEESGVEHPGRNQVNHIIVSDGRIQYCADCTHSLAGQTLDLLEFTDAEIATWSK